MQPVSQIRGFVAWFDSNANKLPWRAIRNIVYLLYGTVEGVMYAAVHPVKTVTSISRKLVSCAHALVQPETWSKVGCGMVGAKFGFSLVGFSLVNETPLSIIGVSLAALGCTLEMIKVAFVAERGKKLEMVLQKLFAQAKAWPESLLTGFCMGLLFGAAKCLISQSSLGPYQIGNAEEAKLTADTIINKHHLPQYQSAEVTNSAHLVIKWTSPEAVHKFRLDESFVEKWTQDVYSFKNAQMTVTPDSQELFARYDGHTSSCEYVGHTTRGVSLAKLGITESLYPELSPLASKILSHTAQGIGGVFSGVLPLKPNSCEQPPSLVSVVQ
jgi:hypothetical protein